MVPASCTIQDVCNPVLCPECFINLATQSDVVVTPPLAFPLLILSGQYLRGISHINGDNIDFLVCA